MTVLELLNNIRDDGKVGVTQSHTLLDVEFQTAHKDSAYDQHIEQASRQQKRFHTYWVVLISMWFIIYFFSWYAVCY